MVFIHDGSNYINFRYFLLAWQQWKEQTTGNKSTVGRSVLVNKSYVISWLKKDLEALSLYNLVVVVVIYWATYGVVTKIFTPLQAQFVSNSNLASLLFLPHGVRVLTCVIYGARWGGAYLLIATVVTSIFYGTKAWSVKPELWDSHWDWFVIHPYWEDVSFHQHYLQSCARGFVNILKKV